MFPNSSEFIRNFNDKPIPRDTSRLKNPTTWLIFFSEMQKEDQVTVSPPPYAYIQGQPLNSQPSFSPYGQLVYVQPLYPQPAYYPNHNATISNLQHETCGDTSVDDDFYIRIRSIAFFFSVLVLIVYIYSSSCPLKRLNR